MDSTIPWTVADQAEALPRLFRKRRAAFMFANARARATFSPQDWSNDSLCCCPTSPCAQLPFLPDQSNDSVRTSLSGPLRGNADIAHARVAAHVVAVNSSEP